MTKIITIDRCLDCRHCTFRYADTPWGYFCTNSKLRKLDYVEVIPEWCELEEATDEG